MMIELIINDGRYYIMRKLFIKIFFKVAFLLGFNIKI